MSPTHPNSPLTPVTGVGEGKGALDYVQGSGAMPRAPGEGVRTERRPSDLSAKAESQHDPMGMVEPVFVDPKTHGLRFLQDPNGEKRKRGTYPPSGWPGGGTHSAQTLFIWNPPTTSLVGVRDNIGQ